MPAEEALRKHYNVEPTPLGAGAGRRGTQLRVHRRRAAFEVTVTIEPLAAHRRPLRARLIPRRVRLDARRRRAAFPRRAGGRSASRGPLAGLGLLRARAKELDAAIPFSSRRSPRPRTIHCPARTPRRCSATPSARSRERWRSTRTPARFRKARELAECALAAARTRRAGAADIGTSWTVEATSHPAIARWRRAASPRRAADLALQFTPIYLRSGQRDKANALYATEFEHVARQRRSSSPPGASCCAS